VQAIGYHLDCQGDYDAVADQSAMLAPMAALASAGWALRWLD